MSNIIWEEIGKGLIETLQMTVISALLAYIIGLPLGVLLVVTDKEGIHPIPLLQKILGTAINLSLIHI